MRNIPTKDTIRGSALAIGMAASLLLATGGADAQRRVTPPGIQEIPAPVERMLYRDSDGPGIMEISPGASDPATGGSKIRVRIFQNGWISASGFTRVISPPPPPNVADLPTVNLVVFTAYDGYGQPYVFRGEISRGFFGNHFVEGRGSYERAGTGVDLDQWRVADVAGPWLTGAVSSIGPPLSPLPARRMIYHDSDGSGVLEITRIASDWITEGYQVQVRVSQNGFVATGFGFQRTIPVGNGIVADPPPALIVFVLRDSIGRAYLFRGQIPAERFFPGASGSGVYERAGTGVDLDQWQVFDP